ncbi:MAG TPA: hypothetical protein VF079_04720 [Sphingomicrobium sp.]
MKFKPLLLFAVGFGLLYVGHDVGLMGDAAPLVPGGVSPERAKYHVIALLLTLGALGCFIAAGVSIFREWRRR